MKTIALLLSFLTISIQAATVSWQALDGATSYRLYWSTNQNAPMPWAVVGNPTGTNVVVAETAGATNYFRVTAMTADGETLPSDIAFHPRTPIAVLSSGLSSDTISVTPNPASDKVTLYCVYWSTDKNAPLPWSLLASNSSPVITVTGNYAQGTKNCYRTTAKSLCGESLGSILIRNPGPTGLFISQ